MQQIFIVPGYGVPKDITRDLNYGLYLRIVANTIYEQVQKTETRPTVILSGGPTDCWKPYWRTEAGEMLRWLRTAIRSKDFRRQFKHWKIRLEPRSLSTLENLLFSLRMLKSRSAKKRITIFTEATRLNRWKRLVRAARLHRAAIVPVDFDTSANRYRTDQVHRKEKAVTSFDTWALKRKANLNQHHKFFQRRIEYLRAAGPNNHVKAVRQFWKDGVNFLPPAMAQRLRKYLS